MKMQLITSTVVLLAYGITNAIACSGCGCTTNATGHAKPIQGHANTQAPAMVDKIRPIVGSLPD